MSEFNHEYIIRKTTIEIEEKLPHTKIPLKSMGLLLLHNPMHHITLLVTQNGTNGGLCTSVFFFNFTLIKLSSLIFLGRIFVVFVMSDFTHRTGHVQLADHPNVKAQFCKIVELAKSNVILTYLILQNVLHPFLNYLSLLGEV